jgi:hypothetical protein
MSEAIPPLPSTLSWRSDQLKHRENFTFTSMDLFVIYVCNNTEFHLHVDNDHQLSLAQGKVNTWYTFVVVFMLF